MDYTVIWSLPALLELREIVDYIALDSEPATQKVHAEIDAAVRSLTRMPFSGAVYEKDSSGSTRETLCRKYRIFYEVDGLNKTVMVLSIWHGSRREPIF